MSRGFDVLAALRQIADGEGDVEVIAMRVHAAVEELIEADEDLVMAELEVAGYEAITPYRSRNYCTVRYVRKREAIALLRSALSRIRGAA